ncbi:MAG TPA: hypothetical protein VJM31_12565 [Vicinamibacterales bacterium]|nr:hypothetical protein [Vicinamibacterales bacterium]
MADEDSLTGALGQAISMDPVTFNINGARYEVSISHTKLRGRGKNAPEKRFGADGLFQIEMTDAEGRSIRRKGLPFQCKKRWSGPNQQLVKQCADMESEVGSGLVIDFSPNGYTACMAVDAIQAGGSRRRAQVSGKMKQLGQTLANDFLNCTIGQIGLFYDPEREIFSNPRDYGSYPDHVLTTAIQRLR